MHYHQVEISKSMIIIFLMWSWCNLIIDWCVCYLFVMKRVHLVKIRHLTSPFLPFFSLLCRWKHATLLLDKDGPDWLPQINACHPQIYFWLLFFSPASPYCAGGKKQPCCGIQMDQTGFLKLMIAVLADLCITLGAFLVALHVNSECDLFRFIRLCLYKSFVWYETTQMVELKKKYENELVNNYPVCLNWQIM